MKPVLRHFVLQIYSKLHSSHYSLLQSCHPRGHVHQLKKVCVNNFQKSPFDSEVQISHFVRNDKASACFRGQGANRLPEAACSHPVLLYESASVNPTVGGFCSGQGAF